MPLGGSSFRGFPFDEEECSGAWSSLAARHPDIAARLRQRPATWARKRRPSSQDAGDDFSERFGDFDRFPFDDIPPEFRDHFPTHWGRRFEEPAQQHPQHPQHPPPQPAAAPGPASPQPQQTTAATQTELPTAAEEAPHLPQYGLRNTVDLGQKSATDPSVDADDRNQRSVSAPPDARASQPRSMSSNHHEPAPPDHQANVRHIPIFVEGRDEPVINRTEHAHFAEPKPHYAPPPPPPHVDRDQYFADDGPATFHHPPNFSRAFGTPFNKGFRQGPQPFVQQKVYPQTAFARGASPQRSQSPKAQPHPEEQHTKHEPTPRAQPPPPPPQPPQQPPQQPPPQPHAASPPPKPQPTPKDPITTILSIQTDVLNLMSEVENFVGTKKDKKYIFLDEMLTRNLIKLDNIETEGKENIRQARKEAIKCIEKCIAVLEAKADGRTAASAPAQPEPVASEAAANGEVDMKEESTKEGAKDDDTQEMKEVAQKDQQKPEDQVKVEAKPEEIKEESKPEAADTRPEENRAVLVEKPQEKSDEGDKKGSPKKSTKVVKKRDKSKDKNKDSPKEAADEKKLESMQVVDDKGDKTDPQMEVDGAAASQ